MRAALAVAIFAYKYLQNQGVSASSVQVPAVIPKKEEPHYQRVYRPANAYGLQCKYATKTVEKKIPPTRAVCQLWKIM
jgi:hypothetical protein